MWSSVCHRYQKFLCIIFFAATLFISLICPAKGKEIDSLKKALPGLKDTARIDCLGQLSRQYIIHNKKASAEYYALQALNEAKELNFIHGIAVAFSLQAQIAKHFDDDFVKAEKLGKQSLYWFERTGNKEGIIELYDQLWLVLFAQSRYDESLVFAKLKLEYAKSTGSKIEEIRALSAIGTVYRESGNYEMAFSFHKQAYQVEVQSNNQETIALSLFHLGELYMIVEDYPTALRYFRWAFSADNKETRLVRQKVGWDIWIKMEFAEIFSHLQQFDSAWYYYRLFEPKEDKSQYASVFLVSSGECFFLQKNYNNALQNFLKALPLHKKLNDRNQVMRTLLALSKTYLVLGKYRIALHYAKEGLDMALAVKANQYIRDGFRILYSTYEYLRQIDSAYFFYKKFDTLNDIVTNIQIKAKFSAYDYDQKLLLLNKEKQIHETKLYKEKFLNKVLIFAFLLFFVLSFFIFRNIVLRRKNDKLQLEKVLSKKQFENQQKQAELQQQASILEMQALRAQMNPHFIFNSLNSINRFILQNDKLQASEYLTKFSRLVRLILQNSQADQIPLESELEALRLYLDLEAVRFDQHFGYEIKVDGELDMSAIQLPPLIIQPYAENAIWHGLMHKEEKGYLEVSIFEKEETLCIRITDDGIGRKKAAELKSKTTTPHKSMGMQITANRIANLQQNQPTNGNITIQDLTLPDGNAGGTEVILKIPLHYA